MDHLLVYSRLMEILVLPPSSLRSVCLSLESFLKKAVFPFPEKFFQSPTFLITLGDDEM